MKKEMKEYNIQTLFSKAIKTPGVYELKLEKGKSMPYNKVEDHQIHALLDVRLKGFFHKINDQPWGTTNKFRFTNKKPFDCFYIEKYPAYVGICFYKPRQKKEVICIDIADYIHAEKTDSRKSLTEEKAKEIAEFIIEI